MNYKKQYPNVFLGFGIVLALFLLYIISKGKNAVSAVVASVVNTVQSVGATIDGTEAQRRANMLLEAMTGLGTDFVMVLQAFDGMNKADYYKIKDKFGFQDLMIQGSEDLVWWLKDELRVSQIGQLKMLHPYLANEL